MCPMFVGELAGNRVIRVGIGVTDVTPGGIAAVLCEADTQDHFPSGGGGSVMFTQLNVTVRHTNGFAIGVTPVVDGAADTEQTFNVGAAAVGSDGIFTVKAPFRLRGERCAAKVRQTAGTDVVELVDIAVTYVPIRAVV